MTPKSLVNDAVRLGLRPGIDPDRLNQLVDELEVEAVARTLERSASRT